MLPQGQYCMGILKLAHPDMVPILQATFSKMQAISLEIFKATLEKNLPLLQGKKPLRKEFWMQAAEKRMQFCIRSVIIAFKFGGRGSGLHAILEAIFHDR